VLNDFWNEGFVIFFGVLTVENAAMSVSHPDASKDRCAAVAGVGTEHVTVVVRSVAEKGTVASIAGLTVTLECAAKCCLIDVVAVSEPFRPIAVTAVLRVFYIE